LSLQIPGFGVPRLRGPGAGARRSRLKAELQTFLHRRRAGKSRRVPRKKGRGFRLGTPGGGGVASAHESWLSISRVFVVFNRQPHLFMKEYQAADIRNFAVVGHASAGKTLLCEAMLACAGVNNRMGSIANGSTVSDYHVSELNRQISVQASLLHAEWLGKKFNIIDCPGYADFLSEGLGA
jgi:hypothetical protein